MSGIQLLNEQPMNYRNKMIVGIALALGLGIDAVPDILQFCPQLVRNIFAARWWYLSLSCSCSISSCRRTIPGHLTQ